MALADRILKQMPTRALSVSFLFALIALPCFAQDFNWSWEEKEDAKKADSAADSPAAPMEKVGKEGEFDWSWTEDGSKPDGSVAKPAAPQPTRIRDDEAYQKLLKENLELRRNIADALKDGELAKKENERLAGEIRDMEDKLMDSVKVIQTLKSTQKASMSPEEISELEIRLAKAEKSKDELSSELERLKRMKEKEPKPDASATAGIVAGSDIYKQSEEENVMLKKRLSQIESDRRKLAKEAEEAKHEAEAARTELQAVSEKAIAAARQGAKYKKIVETLPQIEKQVTELKTDVAMKSEKLSAREQQLDALRTELEQRERRLAKAQKMAALLEKVHREVQEVDNKEKLDMHYNMAVVYAKEGRPGDAEKEYLKALQIDPADADIHYNLGILYDQDLKDTRKAIGHYRRYLTLRPNASDSDKVKGWILDLEMKR